MPDSDREFVQRALRIGITLGSVLAGVVLLLWLLKSALTPLAVAFVIAYLFDPILDRFEARRIARGFAVFVLLALTGAAIAAFIVVLLPRMQTEIVALAARLPGYVEQVSANVLPWLEQRGVPVPEMVGDAISRLKAGEFPLPLAAARDLLGHVVGLLTGTVGALVGLLVVPVIAYYFLVEFDGIKERLLHYVPRDHQPYVIEKATTIDRLVSGFIRGQLTVCLILGTLYAVGFAAIGIDLALLIGFGAGLLAIIPYLGNLLAVVAASSMALLEFGVGVQLLLVLGWYGVVQVLEGTVLTPRIVGRSLGMHPVTVIVALLIGGDLLGFLGLLVAVPLAAVVQVFVGEALEAYRRTAFYRGDAPEADDGPHATA